MSRNVWVLPATVCALAGVLACTPIAGAATARTGGARSTSRDAHPSQHWAQTTLSPVRLDVRRIALMRLLRTASRPRIIGGSGAAAGEWGFMAFIAYFDASGNPEFVCSGTVVAPNVVLTAGHCAVDETTGAPLDPTGYAVVTGTLDWTTATQSQVSPVSRVIIDPAYDPAVLDTTDAALLVLTDPTSVPTIGLATTADQYLDQAGTGSYIVGWGATYDGDTAITALLQWAPTVVQRSAYCSSIDGYFQAASELCAVNPPTYSTGTCVGDSGGPLATDSPTGSLIEIGITTYGPDDCDTYTPDYFTNIIPISSWVASWIRAVAPPPPPQSPPPAPPAASAPPSAPTPTLTLSDAKDDVRTTLAGALGQRFNPAHQYKAKCSRSSSTRVSCSVKFWHGPNDYFGNVSINDTTGQFGDVVWTDQYTIHWVNDECYFHSGHREQCSIHTRHGSW